jgi:hypothetical protein
MQYEGNKTFSSYDSSLKKLSDLLNCMQRERYVKIKGEQMVFQFCKFQETLFRKVVVIDEYYYQLK